MRSRNYENCNTDVHRACYAKHLRSKLHLEKEEQNELIITEWFLYEPIENKPRIKYNPHSLKQKARENIKLDDKQLNEVLAEKRIFLPFLLINFHKLGLILL